MTTENSVEELQRWINVSDCLPAHGEWVLVHNGKWTGVGKYVAGERNYEGELDPRLRWQDERTEYIEHLGPKVTHWMPLPAAPKESK